VFFSIAYLFIISLAYLFIIYLEVVSKLCLFTSLVQERTARSAQGEDMDTFQLLAGCCLWDASTKNVDFLHESEIEELYNNVGNELDDQVDIAIAGETEDWKLGHDTLVKSRAETVTLANSAALPRDHVDERPNYGDQLADMAGRGKIYI
jgi:hypothetical protein